MNSSVSTSQPSAHEIFSRVITNIERSCAASGTRSQITRTFTAGGHVLLEDFPGTGKTTLAKALAKSVVLPLNKSAIHSGPASIRHSRRLDLRSKGQAFRFHRGPIFANIVLADEINRASPRTQSALLEAMGNIRSV